MPIYLVYLVRLDENMSLQLSVDVDESTSPLVHCFIPHVFLIWLVHLEESAQLVNLRIDPFFKDQLREKLSYFLLRNVQLLCKKVEFNCLVRCNLVSQNIETDVSK